MSFKNHNKKAYAMPNVFKFILISGAIIILLVLTGAIGFGGLIGLFFLMMVIAALLLNNEIGEERKQKKNRQIDDFKALKNFTTTKRFINSWGLIAIDENRKQIALKEKFGKIRKYHYSAILSCEILEDGVTTYRKTRTVGRAIVGGIIAGGAGAIIGGLSGKEIQNKEIKNVDLKIVIKDTNKPSYKIRFFDAAEETNGAKKSIKNTDPIYGREFKKATNRLKYWKDIIEIIINKIDGEQTVKQNNISSISDELIKLNDLKEKGILTEEEFQQQKKKILE